MQLAGLLLCVSSYCFAATRFAPPPRNAPGMARRVPKRQAFGDINDSDSESTSLTVTKFRKVPNDNAAFLAELDEFRRELYPEAHLYDENPLNQVDKSTTPIRAKALEAKWLPIQVQKNQNNFY